MQVKGTNYDCMKLNLNTHTVATEGINPKRFSSEGAADENDPFKLLHTKGMSPIIKIGNMLLSIGERNHKRTSGNK